jgi:hypothetical protein
MGGAESPVELIWGIGVVNWQKDGRLLDRPLLERRVEIELDDTRGGLIRIRPTGVDALFDLKPYEELGCANLVSLADLIRQDIRHVGENEGISPFARESFEPILSQAGVRLDPEGCYAPDTITAAVGAETPHPSRLMVTDKWVLFARPRYSMSCCKTSIGCAAQLGTKNVLLRACHRPSPHPYPHARRRFLRYPCLAG